MSSHFRKQFDIRSTVFFPSAIIIIIFVGLTLLFHKETEAIFQDFQDFMSKYFGWLVIVGINYILLFVIFLAISRFGKIRIGGDSAKPSFSKLSWIAMLFSAGMGIGLVYFSVAEPMYHYSNPIYSGLNNEEKAMLAMEHTFFHYGFHVWGIYCFLGIALAYFCFNRNLPLSLRSTLCPILGRRIFGRMGDIIDTLAVLSILFGLATSLGFGAIQFSSGISELSGVDNSVNLQVITIASITLIATASVISGLHKGLKILSNINITLALILFFFVLLIGSSISILSDFGNYLLSYLKNLPYISTIRGANAENGEWFNAWSLFYWTWWISWSPFVATFIARISKGRTIREIAIFGVLLPATFSFLWMSVLGGTALDMQISNQKNLAVAVQNDSSTALYKMLAEMPLSSISMLITVILVATFFITSSDSGSLVVDFITAGGKLDTPKAQKVFWAFMEGAIAIALLIGGGLSALQSVSISTGFPFTIVLIIISFSLMKDLYEPRNS